MVSASPTLQETPLGQPGVLSALPSCFTHALASSFTTCPLLLESKEFAGGGQRTSPVRSPCEFLLPGSPSSPDAWDPRGPTTAAGAQGLAKASLAPDHPLLRSPKNNGGVKAPLPHDGRGVPAQTGSHQKNRRGRFASCGPGWASASCRRGRPPGRGPLAALVMELLLESAGGRLEGSNNAVLSGRQNHTGSGSGAPGAMPLPPHLPLGPGVGSGETSRTKGRPGGLCQGPQG